MLLLGYSSSDFFSKKKLHGLFCLQVTVSSWPWNLQCPTAETRVCCFTKGRPFISEVNYVSDKSLVTLSTYSFVKTGIYKQSDRSEYDRPPEFQ